MTMRSHKKLLAPFAAVAMALALVGTLATGCAFAQQQATGVVYHDANENAVRDAGEEGLTGIRVSNGRDVALTDTEGRYRLEVDNDDVIFVIKPRNWMTATDENNTPRFYYVHKPEGSPDLHYPGVEPTGDLPDSVDFPLYPQEEPEQFKALFFGDPQPRNEWETDFVVNDVLDPIAAAGTDAAMSFALGDIVNDPLHLLDDVSDAWGVMPTNNYFVLGNHDMNYDALSDEYADETWERVFGPATYSLDYGPVHFIVIDDVIWHPGDEEPDSYNAWKKQGHYTSGISDEDLEFLRNDLALVPKDALVVYMFHIPLLNPTSERHRLQNYEEFMSLFEGRENVLGFSGHTHTQYSGYANPPQEGEVEVGHLHVTATTACGAWWAGEVDEYGFPVSPCRDNVPNGHLEVSFDEADFSMQFVPARRPRSHQMIVWAPQVVAADTDRIPVYANVFLGNKRSTVEMRVEDGEWVTMEHVPEPQKEHVEMLVADRKAMLEGVGRANQAEQVLVPGESAHLWFADAALDLDPGYHTIEVRSTDMFGQTWHGMRTIRIQ
jgi:hypothetical protein